MMTITGLGCSCGLGEDPPPVPPPVTPADVQTAINTALANQQLALASQLEAQRRDERAQVMEWQAMRARSQDAQVEDQWLPGVTNQTALLVAAGVAVVGMIAFKK